MPSTDGFARISLEVPARGGDKSRSVSVFVGIATLSPADKRRTLEAHASSLEMESERPDAAADVTKMAALPDSSRIFGLAYWFHYDANEEMYSDLSKAWRDHLIVVTPIRDFKVKREVTQSALEAYCRAMFAAHADLTTRAEVWVWLYPIETAAGVQKG